MDIRFDIKTAAEFGLDKRFAKILEEAGLEYVRKLTEVYHKHGLSFIEGSEMLAEIVEVCELYGVEELTDEEVDKIDELLRKDEMFLFGGNEDA